VRHGDRHAWNFDGIGTRWSVETAEPLAQAVRRFVLERVERFDVLWSRFRPDSLVSRIAVADGGVFVFPDDAVGLLDLYDGLVAATDGAVDPLVGRQLELLGYDAAYSLAPAPWHVREQWMRDRPTWLVDVQRDGATVVIRRPLLIDVGAAGKGALVDAVSQALGEAGVEDHLVDAGGDLRHRGQPAVRIGLSHPLDPGLAVGVVPLENGSLCASATNRRCWGDGLHHLLDARTNLPVRDVLATWVVAADTATADGLATALFTTGAHRLREHFRFDHVRLLTDGRVERSAGFPGELFTHPVHGTVDDG
jgi:thiamine biosynthesis lipoprotein